MSWQVWLAGLLTAPNMSDDLDAVALPAAISASSPALPNMNAECRARYCVWDDIDYREHALIR